MKLARIRPRLRSAVRRFGTLLLLAFLGEPMACQAASSSLPKRLILLVDGVSYRDMKALQAGVTYTNLQGRHFHRQAFHRGFFPVGRNISTFPSASDVAWTEILGDPPVPGYQRTYFDAVQNKQVFINGVTSSVEYERQMTWQLEGSFRRILGYAAPRRTFAYELKALAEDFLHTTNGTDNYYALIHSTDSAQHLSGDIFALLETLDEKLRDLSARYREREGKDLEIVLLSDHGNNHAGAGRRVAIKGLLRSSGYRIRKSLQDPRDVILPTAGIESWVEIHNAPAATESLLKVLTRLRGVDLLTAQFPGQAHRFIVMNGLGERALIDWNPGVNSFRYAPETGDPLGYRPVVAALARKQLLDAGGYASAEAWLAETLDHQYPLALERIARGHTQVTANPASILLSLKNEYVHCGWIIKRGIALVTSGGTHGSLDAINSNGMVMSNFRPTPDTSTRRVAALFGGFTGLRETSKPAPMAHRPTPARATRQPSGQLAARKSPQPNP